MFVERPNLEVLACQACTAEQFKEDHYLRLAEEIGQAPTFHRKQWEYIYILRAFEQFGLLNPGIRGLGFGCGKEPLAAVLAKNGVNVLATDIAPLVGSDGHWGMESAKDLFYGGICEEETFLRNVSYRAVDMNDIPSDLAGFDFVWSCCALEHLGSLRAGMDFILNSADCLSPGGIAVHTTELNVSDPHQTLELPDLSLYRPSDIVELQRELLERNCALLPLNFYKGNEAEDLHIDLPPYLQTTHLKLLIEPYVVTSFGLVIMKGTD